MSSSVLRDRDCRRPLSEPSPDSETLMVADSDTLMVDPSHAGGPVSLRLPVATVTVTVTRTCPRRAARPDRVMKMLNCRVLRCSSCA